MSTKQSGLIQVYTGDGKGKTTAALGQVLRAVGAGKQVAVLFFDKGGEDYSERAALDQLGVDYWAFGRDRRLSNNSFDFSITDQDQEQSLFGLYVLLGLYDQYDLLVLDEFNVVVSTGQLPLELALAALELKTNNSELILTGRNAPKEFLDRADLISEIQNKKHYLSSGVQAREGLDF